MKMVGGITYLLRILAFPPNNRGHLVILCCRNMFGAFSGRDAFDGLTGTRQWSSVGCTPHLAPTLNIQSDCHVDTQGTDDDHPI
jgi:hypothetical protein